MPPKPMFTREEIVQAALDIVSERGIEALTARELGVRLEPVEGVVHRAQSPEAIGRVKALALQLDDFRLTGLATATPLLGSAVLGLALERGALTGEAAFDLSRIEEDFQEGQWGVDAEAEERTAARRSEANLLDRWFRALR